VRVEGKEQVMAKADRASNPDTPTKKRENREVVRGVVAVVGLVLLIAFVLANSETVKVGFVFFHARVSLIWVLLISAFLGALVDRLVIFLMQRRKRSKGDT
jgi:uncharacterized integral membrane protein